MWGILKAELFRCTLNGRTRKTGGSEIQSRLLGWEKPNDGILLCVIRTFLQEKKGLMSNNCNVGLGVKKFRFGMKAKQLSYLINR